MSRRYLLLTSLLFILALPAAAQISGRFSQVPFPEFVRSVESQTNYRFYYDPAVFDSLTVSINAADESLGSLLDSLFTDTDYFYAVSPDQRVYLTRGRELRWELPIGYFDQGVGDNDFEIAISDLSQEDSEQKRLAEEQKLMEIGQRSRRLKTGRAEVSGNIRNEVNGEPVVGAVIVDANTGYGAVTDPFGHYTINLPVGRSTLRISCLGMVETVRQLMVYENGRLDINLRESITPLKEVVVESERGANVRGTQMGLEKLDMKTMKQVPVAFGEADVLKVVLTLPGVQTVGESATGLNVRGGSTDQNLILLDDATIYNTAHLFGFFSAFNPDVVKGVELYKSGIPAEYGGRISSVMEVETREGNKKKFSGSGGIGLITGRLTLEGPIKKDKTSILVGGRSTYSDWLLERLPDESLQNSSGSFYDVNLHVSHEADAKNSISLTGYYSNDRFRLDDDTVYRYNNLNGALRWKRAFSDKLFGTFTGSFSQYGFEVSSSANATNAFVLDYQIAQINAKADFSYQLTEGHLLSFGAAAIRYDLKPGSLQPVNAESEVIGETLDEEQALEYALYVGDQFEINPRLTLYGGLRFSFYHLLGPGRVFQYPGGIPRDPGSVTDTLTYGRGKVINSYQGPEYRVSARYMLSETASFKLGFQRMRQYIHMLSNTTAISPTDTWKLSDPYIKPQLGDQVSVGFYKNFKSNTIETSVEGYYKTLENFLDFKGGAVLTMNENIETDVISTTGKAYGIELLIKKVTGKFNGWISYTYSRSLLKTENPLNELVNRGETYPSNFDKPHDVTVISNYRFSRRFSMSLNFTYSTGRPFTVPIQRYELEGSERLYYTDRNQARIPDYYRADFALNFEGNHKVRKLAHSSWSFSVYNLTGRKNAYSVFFRTEEGVIKGYKLTIFAQPIPTITYNFKF